VLDLMVEARRRVRASRKEYTSDRNSLATKTLRLF
jgi:hypothetical protein